MQLRSLNLTTRILMAALFFGTVTRAACAADSIESLTAIRLGTNPPKIVLTQPAAKPAPGSATVILGDADLKRLVSVPLSDFAADESTYALERPRAESALTEIFDATSAESLRAWLIRDSVVVEALPDWPDGAPLVAHVESVGPGAASAWIDLGSAGGVRVGDEFLALIRGQPALRFDVRSVESDLAWCRMTRLARGATVAAGDPLFAWPTPAERRRGAARAIVCYIEQSAGSEVLWIARLPREDVPHEPRVEVFHDGRYVGFASVERHDALFWYARVLPAAAAGQVAVGDTAVIRTRADIAASRISARVFDRNEYGALITAGEEDGIAAGQVARALRGDRSLGLVEVLRVTGGYATIRPVVPPPGPASRNAMPSSRSGLETAAATAPVELERLDEIRFAAPRMPDRVVGRILSADGDAVVIGLAVALPLKRGQVLGVRGDDDSVGVAIVLDAADDRAVNCAPAYLLPQSHASPIRPGAAVLQPAAPDARDAARAGGN